MPYVQQALEALAVKIQQERLQLAAGVDREEGKYLPHGWRPFCPHRWMAEYVIAHKPQAADAAVEGS
ncbi:hypothetical protein OEZ86_002740 [Tetradesmus obliquus]|uniref:Uncharacterized protein n=1 Tax=Tetradesmus obliquus TaxID=3088 RepID=A0A383VJL0_TETOB|nr:hypothetical protein OEZ86_002740 [Tetradesmus obliquus]|eukprot:jgi/Sobl393_1/815/SZX64556.1